MATAVRLKVLMLGDSGVGKSSLMLRFTDDNFLPEDETRATVGVDSRQKALEVDGIKYRLTIWDTAGQERFRALASSYYRKADLVFLVYDVSSRKSFDSVNMWLREVETYCGEGVVKVLVGNKTDKASTRQVTMDQGQTLANRLKAELIECSAKSASGVERMFHKAVEAVAERNEEMPGAFVSSPGAQQDSERNSSGDERRVELRRSLSEAELGGWAPACGC